MKEVPTATLNEEELLTVIRSNAELIALNLPMPHHRKEMLNRCIRLAQLAEVVLGR